MTAASTAIAIDIGGTFTDVVALDDTGRLRVSKLPTTRSDPSAAVRTVLGEMLRQWEIAPAHVVRFVHGTTVATNAVLERKGARLGLLTTAGYEDVLEIGRQSRQQIYELMLQPETPVFLAPGARRKGVTEAIGPDGTIEQPLDHDSLARSVDELVRDGVEAIAVCFLCSFANPVHERIAADYIRRIHPQLEVSISSDVDPAFREYERTVVTAFDAYVKSGLDRYLAHMERDLRAAGIPATLQIMQSRGGVCSTAVARQRPIRLFLSGPAAGVIGAGEVGQCLGRRDLITIDIGGTSSDIALISDGQPIIHPEGMLDGFRIRVPMVDINSIGSGGGSIAWLDAGGGLRVGPQSAGAEPGPASYARGGMEPTVTDASVVRGLIDPAYFAGGSLRLQPELAARAIEERIAKPLGLSVREAALGIHRVVNAQMAEGIRLVSVKRGVDPRAYALVAFGGAGALHAVALARELDIESVIVPRYAGVLSAIGLLSAMIEHEASAAFLDKLAAADTARIAEICRSLQQQCEARMREEGVPLERVRTSFHAEVCYVGQAHSIEVAIAPYESGAMLDAVYAEFCALHERIYGHSTRGPARFVNLRAVQRATNRIATPATTPTAVPARPKATREVLLESAVAPVAAAVYERDALAFGQVVTGPAIVEQADTTTLIEAGWQAEVVRDEILLITRASPT